jgi:hypothetical protein
VREPEAFYGFEPLPHRGEAVSNQLIDRLREDALGDSRPSIVRFLLLARIKSRLTALEELLGEVSSHWGYEDPVYRFYHLKVRSTR